MTDGTPPVVLIVEDEPDVAETYELWLAADYEVRRASDGRTALDTIDDSVDVVLLDRMMPGTSGDEVLAELRAREVDCRVAMVTAVDPDFDIIEMGFDDYVTKPPTRESLRATVADLVERGAYAERVVELRSLVARQAALEAEKSPVELAASDRFAELEARIETRRESLADEREQFLDDGVFVSTLRDLTAGER